jgi:hypothetical protein
MNKTLVLIVLSCGLMTANDLFMLIALIAALRCHAGSRDTSAARELFDWH